MKPKINQEVKFSLIGPFFGSTKKTHGIGEGEVVADLGGGRYNVRLNADHECFKKGETIAVFGNEMLEEKE